MEEQYIKLETARLLKKAGFMPETDYIYLENGNSFPKIVGRRSTLESFPKATHQLACKWLRETHNLHIYAFRSGFTDWCYEVQEMDGELTYSKHCNGTYEEAIEEAILYCINNNFKIPQP